MLEMWPAIVMGWPAIIASFDVGDPSLLEQPLEAGMVFTVEPWYYNHDRGIAVFVEDDILVTAEGRESLSHSLPRSPGGLERLIRDAG